ncbi:MAG: hypothetical protein IJM40_09930 [Synergistaceae bacterium]|nr:hypothetical protein [Synergistaceae bacterium]
MVAIVNERHKDRVFRFIFGNEENKEWTLSLYNALNGSNYDDPDLIQFNTIDNAVYLGMKNDVSFIILNDMNLWEHQASFNPNMPVRFLIYAGQLYDKYMSENDIYRYGTRLNKLPKSRCVCFYNGIDDQPEEQILKLSSAFDGNSEADIEVRVKMLNINYSYNKNLMLACEPLYEYAWLVDTVRRYEKEFNSLVKAFDTVITEMPENFLIKKFLVAHKAEVEGMFLSEYDEEKERRLAKREAREEEREEVRRAFISNMIKEKMPLNLIKKISQLPEDYILSIAESLGVSVVMG